MKQILFVCMGNICRSPIAEAVAIRTAEERRVSPFLHFDSAGTHSAHIGEPADPRARQVASRRGYDLSNHRARQVIEKDFERFDAIFAMDRVNIAALRRCCPQPFLPKVQLLLDVFGNGRVTEVPDPYFGNPEGFEFVFDLCESALDRLIEHYRGQAREQAGPNPID